MLSKGIEQEEHDGQLQGEANANVFVARQPIFSSKLQVYGFELLYRNGEENSFDGTTPAEIASARVLANAFLTVGNERLLCGKVPFINFDADLLREYAPLLPFPHAVVEIHECTQPNDDILTACRDLKAKRYQLALDDCATTENIKPWLKIVDIVKVDFIKASQNARKEIAALCNQHRIRPLAQKLESPEAYNEARGLGYEYFQGFFFARPLMIKGQPISDAHLLLLQLLKEVSAEDVDFDRVEKLLQRNVSLVYKLLRFMNSPLFAWQSNIKSVRHALALLGEEELRKWISLLLVAGIGAESPAQLLVNSLVRARFAELLCPKAKLNAQKSSAFLLGLLSHLDALLRRPMAEVLAELQLERSLTEALLGKPDWKNQFALLYELIKAYEKPDWVRTAALAQQFKLSVWDLSSCYAKAVEWADLAAKQ